MIFYCARSMDIEMVNLSTYLPHLSNRTSTMIRYPIEWTDNGNILRRIRDDVGAYVVHLLYYRRTLIIEWLKN